MSADLDISRGSSYHASSSNCTGIDMINRMSCDGREALSRLRTRRGHTGAWLARLALMLLFAIGPAVQVASAQPNLNFKRVINNWPTIELYFSVACDGKPAYFSDLSSFKVFENGLEIKALALWCPDPQQHCAISVALVFDASGSMIGTGQAGAIAAGNAFVDLMDGVSDEASVIIFASSVTLLQGMTTSKSMLHTAVNSIPAAGATAVWDGIYAGLQELIANGSNECRAVIAMTDGGDNSSTRTPVEVISLANRNRIRVYTVGIGSGIDAALLQAIADQTGGKYYHTPSGSGLSQIYQEIYVIISQKFQECVIMYQAKCMDGGLRTVDLQLLNYCQGSDSKTKTYRALKDTATYVPLTIQVGKKLALGNSTVKIPITLMDPIFNDNFHPATFNFFYDDTYAQLQTVSTAGTLLNGVPVTVRPFAGGVTIATKDKMILNGAGTLMELTFKTADLQGIDSVHIPLTLEDWVFEAGCFNPRPVAGELAIVPARPELTCSLTAPAALTWSGASKSYTPNPVRVEMRVQNTGTKSALNSSYRIEFNPADFTLVSPASTTQAGSPLDIAAGATGLAAWNLQALPRTTSDSVSVCIVASFSNAPDVRCCKKIWIPWSGTALTCSMTVPTITANETAQIYDPMPFDVTVYVRNDGVLASDTVRVQLTLPGAVQFAAPDNAGTAIKLTTPPVIPPGMTGQVTWRLSHPIVQTRQNYTLSVTTLHRGRTEGTCTKPLVIPALLPPLAVSITPDGPTTFCEGGAVTLDAGPGYSSYQWSSGERTRTIVVRTAGSYTVRVTDSFGRDVTSPAVIVTVHALPAPKLAITGGDANICPGDTIDIDAGAGFASFLWSTGATTRVLRVAQGGLWWVTVRTAEGCTATSDSVMTLMLPKPPVPVITQTDKVLTTALAGYQYQWYRNGTAIAGATNQFHIATENGTYTLVITNQYGCTSVSAPFDVTTVAAEAPPVPAPFTVACHPNPVTADLDVRIDGEVTSPLTLTLVDATGRVHRTLRDLEPAAHMSHRISMHAAPPGVYFIIASTKDAIQIRKLMRVE